MVLCLHEFISALVDFESGMVEYTCKLGGTQTTFTTETCPVIYPSISAYKGVSSCKVKEVNWVETIRWVFGLYLSREYNQSGKKATFIALEPHLQTFSGLHALVGKSFDNPYKYETQELAFTDAVAHLKALL